LVARQAVWNISLDFILLVAALQSSLLSGIGDRNARTNAFF